MGQAPSDEPLVAFEKATESIRHCRSDALSTDQPLTAQQEQALSRMAQQMQGTIQFTPGRGPFRYAISIHFDTAYGLEKVRHDQGVLDGAIIGLTVAASVALVVLWRQA